MNFHPEQIELLWIIPVLAVVLFIFIIQFVAQKKEQTGLSREVEQFNNGFLPMHHQLSGLGNDRLSQLERAISTITDSLTVQQQTINQFSRGSIDYSSEIKDLKAKLRELYKEYDIVLSENYSLKAKVKKLQNGEKGTAGKDGEETTVDQAVPGTPGNAVIPMPLKVDMKLYEDTCTLNLGVLDDTSEIDLSDLPRRASQADH